MGDAIREAIEKGLLESTLSGEVELREPKSPVQGTDSWDWREIANDFGGRIHSPR